jgi:uroporphyrinogen-III synthase
MRFLSKALAKFSKPSTSKYHLVLLFTRPLPKLAASAQAFDAAGLDAVGAATCDIVYVKSERDAISTFLANTRVDVIIVTSVYAVAAAEDAVQSLIEIALTNRDVAIKSLPLIIAVGDATAKKLRHALYSIPQQITPPIILTPEIHTSEGILAMPQVNEAKGKQVVIIKGEGGRQAIADGLTAKGASCQSFCVYRTEQLADPIYTKCWKVEDVRGIIATSEAMAMQLIHSQGHAILSLPWLTVSERIAVSLRERGVTEVFVCHRATDQALIAWVKDNWEY